MNQQRPIEPPVYNERRLLEQPIPQLQVIYPDEENAQDVNDEQANHTDNSANGHEDAERVMDGDDSAALAVGEQANNISVNVQENAEIVMDGDGDANLEAVDNNANVQNLGPNVVVIGPNAINSSVSSIIDADLYDMNGHGHTNDGAVASNTNVAIVSGDKESGDIKPIVVPYSECHIRNNAEINALITVFTRIDEDISIEVGGVAPPPVKTTLAGFVKRQNDKLSGDKPYNETVNFAFCSFDFDLFILNISFFYYRNLVTAFTLSMRQMKKEF